MEATIVKGWGTINGSSVVVRGDGFLGETVTVAYTNVKLLDSRSLS